MRNTDRRHTAALHSVGLLLAVGMSISTMAQSGTSVQQLTYVGSDENFPNPERGFQQSPYWPWWLGEERNPIRVSELRAFRDQGLSLGRVYFVIDEFRDRSLTAEALTAMSADFAAIRAAGYKIVPRFTYSFPCVGAIEPCLPENFGVTDVPLPRVLEHIAQLAPILSNNADVIAYMEAGFIGAWGEWHGSTNNLTEGGGAARVNDNSKAIVQALLSALPARRMIALRAPHQKQAVFGPAPLSPALAFSGAPQARIGHHNDCFLADDYNYGTYALPYPPSFGYYPELFKQYLSQENRFVPQVGETCSFAPPAQPYVQCPNALNDLQRLQFSVLTDGYQPQVMELWKQQGCFGQIQRRLGYRFRLVSSEIPVQAAAGSFLSLRLVIANDGFAAPYNPRAVELVLRQASPRRDIALPVSADPRFWSAGQTTTVDLVALLPASAEPGSYDVFLNLPDPEPTLRGRPEYSIRLANMDTWEESTGYNRLQAKIVVGPGGGGPAGAVLLQPPLVSGSAVTLHWIATAPVLDYVIEAGSSSGLSDLYNASVGVVTSLTASVPQGTYFVRVRARTSAGTFVSNEVSFTTGAGGGGSCQAAPAAPSGINGGVLAGIARVSWNTVPGATTYVVEAGSNSGTSSLFSGDVGSTLSVSAAVGSGFRAYVRVFAVNACGRSSPSPEIVVQ